MKHVILSVAVLAAALGAGCAPEGPTEQGPPSGNATVGAAASDPAASDPAATPETEGETAGWSAPPSEPARPSLAREWRETRPPKGAEGCYSQQTRPAVIETVTEQVLVRPEGTDPATGAKTPALYRTETNHRIVKGGEAMWFRVPCEAEMTPDFIATLQRALAARALYFGPITGEMDAATQGAVRAYQTPRGLLSPVLSYRAAQELGLIVWVEK